MCFISAGLIFYSNNSSCYAQKANDAIGTDISESNLYPENSPLYFGNPSDAVFDIQSDDNFLMERPKFTLSYNNSKLIPNWVAWHLCTKDLGDSDRSNKFRADSDLPNEWYAVTKNDYKFTIYGFDRGHLCPSADRTANAEDNSITFLMTNMVPQAPDNNRIVWVALEKYERELAVQGYELYIFAGPLGEGGTGDKGFFTSIPISSSAAGKKAATGTNSGAAMHSDAAATGSAAGKSNPKISVPAFTWKIILAIPEGENDLARVDENSIIIAACIPNENGCGKNKTWQDYICTVDYLEEVCGYNFFELLDDNIEDYLESKLWENEND